MQFFFTEKVRDAEDSNSNRKKLRKIDSLLQSENTPLLNRKPRYDKLTGYPEDNDDGHSEEEKGDESMMFGGGSERLHHPTSDFFEFLKNSSNNNNTHPLDDPSMQHPLLLRESHVSLEDLNPHPECKSRKSTTIVAIVNVVASICGGGVLSLPMAFARAGILPTTFLMLFAVLSTDFTLYLLVACARRTGGRSYGDVAQAAFGSSAQIVVTVTLALMLCGTLIAYEVLLRDIWSPVIFTLFPTLKPFAVRMMKLLLVGGADHGEISDEQEEQLDVSDMEEQFEKHAQNLLLGTILVAALPVVMQKDLHSLRHTCYVGVASCFLLMLAVVLRGTQQVFANYHQQQAAHPAELYSSSIKWYSTDPSDILFAYPIVVLCFFCSYNILGVHSQLVTPTRKRVRAVLDYCMIICFTMFYCVGLGGYLYAGQNTMDNILLNFPIDDKAILAGRSGYCLTLMFGLPLVLLPCRDAILSMPKQIQMYQRDHEIIEKYKMVSIRRKGGAHLVINGVDFDDESPHLIDDDPEHWHGAALLIKKAPQQTDKDSGGGSQDSPSMAETRETCETFLETLNASADEYSCDEEDNNSTEEKENDERHHHRHHHHHQQIDKEEVTCCSRGQIVHVISTIVLLICTYTAAVLAPGVSVVWSICGSSLCIWIAFIVPIACYLKIREHKGVTVRSLSGWLLLIISCIAAVVCTRQAVESAMA